MTPIGAGGLFTIGVISIVYLGFFVGSIWWAVFIALRLRDIARHLEAMNVHADGQARNIYSIAASLASLAANSAPPAPPPAQ